MASRRAPLASTKFKRKTSASAKGELGKETPLSVEHCVPQPKGGSSQARSQYIRKVLRGARSNASSRAAQLGAHNCLCSPSRKTGRPPSTFLETRKEKIIVSNLTFLSGNLPWRCHSSQLGAALGAIMAGKRRGQKSFRVYFEEYPETSAHITGKHKNCKTSNSK